ncbi:hypothetical protein ANO14919_030450 [Xylariales sp. No.14919]|nr:hypothetical protein ANO14919_030450 [Xylariales sp. No.14919]
MPAQRCRSGVAHVVLASCQIGHGQGTPDRCWYIRWLEYHGI